MIFLTKDNTNEDMRCREVVADVVQGGVAGRNVSVCRKGGLRVNEGGDGGKDKKEGVKEEGEYVSTSNRLEVYLHGWNEKQWRGEKFSISFEGLHTIAFVPHRRILMLRTLFVSRRMFRHHSARGLVAETKQ